MFVARTRARPRRSRSSRRPPASRRAPRRRPRARGRSPRSPPSRSCRRRSSPRKRALSSSAASRDAPASSPRSSTGASTISCVEVAEHDRHLEPPAGRASRSASPSARRRRCRPSRSAAASRPGRRRPASRAARRGRTRRSTPAPAARAGARRSRPPRRGSPPRATTRAAPSIRSSARYGAGAAPCTWSSTRARAGARRSAVARLSVGGVRSPRSRTRSSAGTRSTRRRTRPARAARRRSPSSSACAPVEHPVLPQRVARRSTLTAFSRADEPRHELRAAPGGEDPEEDLRAAEVPDRASRSCGGRQCSAISTPPPRQAPLIAASVGNGQRAQPAEQLVAGAARLRARARRVTSGNWSMSAPAQKTNGLPVSTQRRPLAALELVERRGRATRAPRGRTSSASCQSSPLSIVTSATGPASVSTRASLNSCRSGGSGEVLPDERRAHAHADAERGEPVARRPGARGSRTRAGPSAGRRSPRADGRTRSRRRTGSAARPPGRRRARRTRSAPGRRTARSARRGRCRRASGRPARARAASPGRGRGPSAPARRRRTRSRRGACAARSPSSSAAVSSEARMQAVAPSVSPAELPAVTRPPGAERRAQVGEPLQRRVRAQELVAVGEPPAVVGEDGHRDDRLAHDAVLPGRGGALLRADGEASASLLRELREAVVQVLGRRAHRHGATRRRGARRRSAG